MRHWLRGLNADVDQTRPPGIGSLLLDGLQMLNHRQNAIF
jgi:hypothetical protein